MKISNRIRLKIVQKRLEDKGVKDIHFCWVPNVRDLFTSDQMAEDACVALEAYLDGKCTLANPFGDRPNV